MIPIPRLVIRLTRHVLFVLLSLLPISAFALDSSDLLFYLSFDSGVQADFSRGPSVPSTQPVDLDHRLVEGVIGKGYLFGGKGSTLVFPVEADESRIGQEMYGPTVNLFGDSGTLTYWLKVLPNETNQHHDFFRFGGNGAFRDHWGVYYFQYAGKKGQMYNNGFPKNRWMNFTVTWRKNEVRSLFERPGITAHRTVGLTNTVVPNPTARLSTNHTFKTPPRKSPIVIDGDLSDWQGYLRQGGLIDTRIGVIGRDQTTVSVTSDDQRMYLSFSSGIDLSEHTDPVRIRYPTGIFKSSPRDRDSDLLADDFMQFVIENADQVYRFSLNPHGVLLDSKNGDVNWNTEGQWESQRDLSNWTGELSIPLAELGIEPGSTIKFNAIRSWKLYKSALNALSVDRANKPQTAPLTLAASRSAAVATIGQPWDGTVAVQGSITGPAGQYELQIQAQGDGTEFTDIQKVNVTEDDTNFFYNKQFDAPGDIALSIEIRDPDGQPILTRTLPLVYVAAASTKLASYPGWDQLEVSVTPVHRENASAKVELIRDGQSVAQSQIKSFPDPAAKVMFDLKDLPPGQYEVLTQTSTDGQIVGEERLPFEKIPKPPWYGSKAGVIEVPPTPWTDMRVQGNRVETLLKQIDFDQTLFPSQITSNEQPLLDSPIRIRVKRNGQERLITEGQFKITDQGPRRVNWQSTAKDGELTIQIEGWIEFDGFTWFEMTLEGGEVDELALEIPMARKSVTLTQLPRWGSLSGEPIQSNSNGVWLGNEKAGLQYWWENKKDWELADQPNTITPDDKQVLVHIPVIQKPTRLDRQRTIAMGWAITPSKPMPTNRRFINMNKTITYTSSYYTSARPNYPSLMPGETINSIQQGLDNLKQLQNAEIVMWYAFGPFMWIGAPEYDKWWREWRVTSWPEVPPNPNSTEWGWACHNSSGSDLFLHKLDAFVRQYPQEGVYVDCYFMMGCDNEAHGCGWVDQHGVRQMTTPLLATRRHYERLYNIIKNNDPENGWVRLHDLAPIMPAAAFCDETWVGEHHIGPIGLSKHKNYYDVIDLPYARAVLRSEQWGHMVNWLTELGVYAGRDPEKRSQWYGKMISPPKDGKHGKWIVPRMKDYHHVAGLVLANDLWNFGGNDMGISKQLLDQMFKDIDMNDSVRFVGYWEIEDELEMRGGVSEKVVCSIYHKPTTDAQGASQKSWLLLVPLNNTDQEVVIGLKPNLKHFGFRPTNDLTLRDVYKGVDYLHQPTTKVNPEDLEPAYIEFKGVDQRYKAVDGEATIRMPARSFMALLIEPDE